MNIINFNYGDEIVRTVPANTPSGNDSSLIGEKLIFLGVSNGMIKLQYTTEFKLLVFGTKPVELKSVYWSDGWERWNETPTSIEFTFVDKSSLEEQLQRAIECEEYEQAIVLRHKINQLKNATK